MIDRSTRHVVCDTGPLISLEYLRDGHDFIRRLFDQVIIPPAVLDELVADLYESAEGYLQDYDVRNALIDVVQSRL